MIVLQKLTEDVSLFLRDKGVDDTSALLVLKTDMGIDTVHKDVWVILNSEKITVAEGVTVLSRPKGLLINTTAEHTSYFDCTRFEQYNISDLKKLTVEEQISSGLISAVLEDKTECVLINFSFTYKHDARVLCSCFSELKKDGKIDESKHEKDKDGGRICPKCGRHYPDPNRKICPKCMDKNKLIKQLAKFFLRYKLFIVMIFITFGLSSLLGVITPWISNKMFYDDVLEPGGKYFGKIGMMVLLIIGVRFLALIINVINGIISAKVAARVVYDLKTVIFNSINRLSMSFFSSRQTGGLMTQINSDSNTLYWFFCDSFPYLVTNSIQLVVVLIIMLIANPLLTLYTFVTIPLFFVTYRMVFMLFSKLHAKSFSRSRSLNSLISDVLSGMRVVKSFSREGEEMERFEKYNNASAEADTVIGVTENKIFPLLTYLLQIGSFVVWGVGGMQIMNGTGGMSYGMLTTFIAYVSLVYEPIRFLAGVSNWWARSLNALQRLFEINDSVADVTEKENAVVLDNVRGDVEFKNVAFSYSEGRNVLEGISFNVKAGTTLGIVGHTGAGKSTLANLVVRLYDPNNGDIFLDGHNLRDISFASLRNSVAIVSQETFLFRGTIMDNIRYAKPDATNEEIINAAKIASAHQFIIKYPDGYQTQVGFGNKDLSGGERQRISIARAVLKNPQILILDEATAAMDTQTERRIQKSLDMLTQGRTTIIIAHRLSTLRNADNLIVIDKGKMPEWGTPHELIEKEGLYYNLYKMQAEALKTIGIEE